MQDLPLADSIGGLSLGKQSFSDNTIQYNRNRSAGAGSGLSQPEICPKIGGDLAF